MTTTYTLTKTSVATGCTGTASITVTVNKPTVTAVAGADFTKTCTSNADGKQIGEASSSDFTYAWTGDGLSATNISNPTANPSVTTTYTVRKTDIASGCFNDDQITVTVNTALPSVTGIGGAFTKTCTSNTSGAQIGETPVSGYAYSWSPSTGLSNAAIGNPTADPTATTTYTVTKTDDANGCSDQATVTVTVNKPTVTAVAGDNFSKTCTTNANGKQIGEASASGYSYAWTGGDGLSATNISNPTANPAATTTYTVTKTHTASGCTGTASITVTVNKPTVTAVAGADFTKTCTSNADGKQIGEASSSDFTYAWTGGSGLSATNISNPVASPTATTTFMVTKTDKASGCTGTASITVTVNTTLPTFTVCLGQPTLCANSGSVTFNANGGSDFVYSINGGSSWSQSNSFSNLASGAVTGYKVKNGYGCETSVSCSSVAISCSSNQAERSTEEVQKSESRVQDITARIGGRTKVLAAPNPFTDKVRFTLESAVSGQGSLEVYNSMGQKIATVYQGYIEAGKQLVKEYHVPVSHRSNLIYVFRVGDQKTSGKLLNW